MVIKKTKSTFAYQARKSTQILAWKHETLEWATRKKDLKKESFIIKNSKLRKVTNSLTLVDIESLDLNM